MSRKILKMTSIVMLVVVLVSYGAYRYLSEKSTSQSAIAAAPEKTVANVQNMVLETLSDNMIVPGVVRADGVVAVTTFSEGIVQNCDVRLGQAVEKNQTLCSVENDNPGATYLPHAVLAPVAGTIGEIHASVGSRVGKGEKIVTVLRSTTSKVDIDIAVQDAAQLKVGMPATWQKLGNGESAGKSTSLRITGISSIPDPATRTVRVELAATNGTSGLPGTMGKVTFVFNSRKGFEVAEGALQYRGQDAFLRTVTNSKVKWVAVKTGRVQKGKVEIVSGVAAGDKVVTSAAKFLADGDDVIVKQENLARK